MKVDQILQWKGAAVFAVRETDAIADAVAVLNEKNIGAVVVRDSAGGAVGILSERDIVRRLGEKGASVLSMSVAQCMTPEPYTCTPDTTLDEIMTLMTDKRIRHLPVTNSGKLVGVISIGDVVRRKIEQAEFEARALKDYISS